MAGARYLIGEIVAFVVGAGLVGLLLGSLIGYGAGRWRRRAARRAARLRGEPAAPALVRERVLVRPDPGLYVENEILRDRLAVLEAHLAARTAPIATEDVTRRYPLEVFPTDVNSGPTVQKARLPDPPEPPEPPRPPDDLTRLRGVGAVVAARLHELGYRTFADIAGIADLDKAGVHQVAKSAGVSARRIRRHRWVEQARELIGERTGT